MKLQVVLWPILQAEYFPDGLYSLQLVNQIIGDSTRTTLPARAALGVASLPKGALHVEMDGVVIMDSLVIIIHQLEKLNNATSLR